jgi:hypothetical protein
MTTTSPPLFQVCADLQDAVDVFVNEDVCSGTGRTGLRAALAP